MYDHTIGFFTQRISPANSIIESWQTVKVLCHRTKGCQRKEAALDICGEFECVIVVAAMCIEEVQGTQGYFSKIYCIYCRCTVFNIYIYNYI